jgi:CubicO group peptidase (beta-lactamase class C family)
MADQNLPGLSVAVGVGPDVVWAEGFGFADLDRQATVTPETRFRIGTASTVLTSAAVGLLLEQGRLRLDDEIQVYVPAYPTQRWPVTLRQVMGHVAGLRSDGGDEGPLLGTHCDRPAEALAEFADRPLLFEPDTDYRFSHYGWVVVSAAIEAATGRAFAHVMRDDVFVPLGMDDTKPDVAAAQSAGRATSYFPRYAAEPHYGLDLMRPIDTSCYAGAMNFVSTPSDLVRFGMGIQRDTVLRPETRRLLQTSQRRRSGADTGYGLGWDLETVTLAGKATPVVGHDGDLLGGRVASLLIVGERGLVIAVTSNTSYADTATLALRIAEAFAP